MDTLIDRLQEQADGLDPTGLDPAGALPGVVRRGRRYLALATAVGAVGATAAVAVAAVAVPQVVEQLRGPTQPTVAATPDGEDVAPPSDEPSQVPIVEQTPQEVVPAGEPAADGGPAPADVTPPEVVVLEPADGATVTSDKVTFAGMTEPGATVMAGSYEASVDADGSFSILLIAAKGANTVTFAATDAAGNTSTTAVTVTYDPGEPADKESGDTGVSDGTLTASQLASVLESPHVNRYSGTAAPGAKVAVVSAYGSSYAWADASGAWVAEVDFSPPAGETTFPVTVKLHHEPSVSRTFQVTTHADQASGVFTANQRSSTLDGAPHKGTYWGTADPGTKVKVLSDHGWAYAWADEAGSWELVVDFDPPGGTTTFPVTARYYHDASVATTFQLTTIAEEAAAFTANQQSSVVSAADPTNVYSGTGEPGHQVWIWTDGHGEATTAVAGDGTWSVPITYAGVTAGNTFAAKAKNTTTGARHLFEVTISE